MDLTKFASTSKAEFEQLSRDRKEVAYRYRVADPSDQADSNNLYDWLFHPNNGVMTWLGL